jgi:predicted nucleic-acid-binding protein
MLVLDTNVLVRLFAGDDREQMRRAVRLIEEAGKRAEPLLVPDLVLAETLWVLGSAKRLAKAQTVKAAEALLGDSRFVFEHRERLIVAVGLFAEQPVDFTEAFAAATALELGANGVVSFEHDLQRLPVRWVEP